MGPASITSFCTGRPWQRRDCARDRWRFYARPAPAPPLDAASGWPQRLVPAAGVIGQVLSRKSNSVRVEAGSRQGQQRTWCVPAGTGRPQGRCVPTYLSFRGDCRQWVAPAVGLGIWSDRVRVVAEKQQRSRRGRGVPGAAAKVVCPRWVGVSPLGALVGWLQRLRMRGG